MTTTLNKTDEIQERIDFADAALNLAGGEVTDPYAREIMRKVAAGELSGDEAVPLLVKHFQG